MYVIHTFFDKSNTIAYGENVNLSLNPVMQLCYGGIVTRGIIHFDVSRLRELYLENNYMDISKLSHRLKMTNTGSLNIHGYYPSCFKVPTNMGELERSSSFKLIFFLIPKHWDAGKGFDYSVDMFEGKHVSYSETGSNWFNATTEERWDRPGIYTIDQMYDAVGGICSDSSDGGCPIIIAEQRFEYGNESIDVDITDAVNKFITGEYENHGIGIAFAPELEDSCAKHTQYVGFFTCHSNTFFEPYVESVYDDTIKDNRNLFYLDKPDNRLYMYTTEAGNPVNLDVLPTCSIGCDSYEVKQSEKGAYYIELGMSSENVEPNTMFYDTWDNIVLHGRNMKPVEMYFTTRSSEGYYQFGTSTSYNGKKKAVPCVYGIQNGEKLHRDEIRKIGVDFIIPYTKEQVSDTYCSEYRIYTMMGDKEIEVIGWNPVDTEYIRSSFRIDTASFVPSVYRIDIRAKYGREMVVHKDVVRFEIVSDATKEKR